jgi:hypothetical protein
MFSNTSTTTTTTTHPFPTSSYPFLPQNTHQPTFQTLHFFQLPSKLLLKVLKVVQGDTPKELQRTLCGLALTAHKLVPIASEALLRHLIVPSVEAGLFCRESFLDAELTVKIKSIKLQSFQSNQHLVAVTSLN